MHSQMKMATASLNTELLVICKKPKQTKINKKNKL